MHFRAIVIGVLPLMLSAQVVAQSLPGLHTRVVTPERLGSIRGTVVMPDGSQLSEAVKVTLKALRGDVNTLYTDQQGRFEMVNIALGQYTIEVDADRERRFAIIRESVQIQRGGGPTMVTLYLKEREGEARAKADKTVSVASLDQKVPAAAKREFDKASHFAAEGNNLEAVAGLQRAIAIYPNYLAAHNDLGAQLLEQGKLDEAVSELQIAIKIDPKAFNPQLNLGIVLFKQNKFSESLTTLDKALSLEPTSPAAHLFAGMDSEKLKDNTRAEKELRAAAELGGNSYAVALLRLGMLYMETGQRELALKSFQSYLRESPNAADADQVQKLIDSLHE